MKELRSFKWIRVVSTAGRNALLHRRAVSVQALAEVPPLSPRAFLERVVDYAWQRVDEDEG